MKNYNLLFCLLLCLTLGACNQILFPNPMPQGGKVLDKIPAAFEGDYIQLEDRSDNIVAVIHEVRIPQKSICEIHKVEINYLDSTGIKKLEKEKGKIDTVFLDANYIYVQTATTTHKIAVSDTAQKTTYGKEFLLNLEEGYFVDDFEGDGSKKKQTCQLIAYKDSYFLNVKAEKEWSVFRIMKRKGNLTLMPTFFDKKDLDRVTQITGKKNVTIKGKSSSKTVIADIDDDTFMKLMNEKDLFESITWVNLNEGGYGLYVLFGFLTVLVFGCIYFVFKV